MGALGYRLALALIARNPARTDIDSGEHLVTDSSEFVRIFKGHMSSTYQSKTTHGLHCQYSVLRRGAIDGDAQHL